jgi:hypothetical protein
MECWKVAESSVARSWRDLYSSPSLIRMTKSRRMRWAGNVARIDEPEKKNAYRLLVGREKERDHLEDQDVRGWITLRWMLEIVWFDIVTSGGLL